MLTQEENERLTRVGPGTPVGELLRRYWFPVAVANEITDEHPTRTRLAASHSDAECCSGRRRESSTRRSVRRRQRHRGLACDVLFRIPPHWYR